MMEVRTKSTNIEEIFNLWFIPKNTEFAFSLNPQILIDKYEKWTPSLDDKIKVINKLLEQGYKVWLRFLPLLPVKDYEEIYREFVKYIKKNIDIKKIHSSFASGLLYTKEDYNKILKKYQKLDILHRLKLEKDDFVRTDREARDFFYKIFKDWDENCMICMDD
jgi:spore photoproduct lyase